MSRLSRRMGRTPSIPHRPSATILSAVGDASQRRQHQGKGVDRHLLHRVVGDVGDHDVVAPGCLEVDVVDAYPVAGDDPAVTQPGQRRFVPRQVGIEDGVGIGCDRQHLFHVALGDLEFGVDLGEHGALGVDAGKHLVADDNLELGQVGASRCGVVSIQETVRRVLGMGIGYWV